MKEISDATLIQFKQGKPTAFKVIFDRLRMRIFYFVKKMITDQLAAEEITADAFVKLYQRHDRFYSAYSILAFLYITARNASLSYLNSRNLRYRHIVELNDSQLIEAETRMLCEVDIETEVLQFIYGEIEKLPSRAKLIFKLSFIEGMSVSEIARKMQIRPQTVCNQKASALKLLRMKALDIPTSLFP